MVPCRRGKLFAPGCDFVQRLGEQRTQKSVDLYGYTIQRDVNPCCQSQVNERMDGKTVLELTAIQQKSKVA